MVLAVSLAVNAHQTRLDILPTGVHLTRIVGAFDLSWDDLAGAQVAKPSFAVRELVVLDAAGRFRRTGVWRWRSGRQTQSLEEVARRINERAAALVGVSELEGRALQTALEEYSREALLRTAGLDEKGAERRSDRMLLLWFVTVFGAAAVGGIAAALTGLTWLGVVVAGVVVAGYFAWAVRQPRLPAQRQAVRLSVLSRRSREQDATDHGH